jgi:hypothetical protein
MLSLIFIVSKALYEDSFETFFFLNQLSATTNNEVNLGLATYLKKASYESCSTQIIPCLSYCPAGIIVISMRSTRVKQFL